MQARAISVDQLVDELVARIDAHDPTGWLRVAVDGTSATEPARLADALVAPLRVRGRDVLRVSAADFLRPASLRFERGKQDPEAFYEDWLDAFAIAREVLDPLDPGGTGRVLPSLWDTARDRATRADYVTLPPGAVVILDGTLLLGRWLPFELTVHLTMTPAVRERRMSPEERWTLPAYERYDQEVSPEEAADIVIRWNNPWTNSQHPAILQ